MTWKPPTLIEHSFQDARVLKLNKNNKESTEIERSRRQIYLTTNSTIHAVYVIRNIIWLIFLSTKVRLNLKIMKDFKNQFCLDSGVWSRWPQPYRWAKMNKSQYSPIIFHTVPFTPAWPKGHTGVWMNLFCITYYTYKENQFK